MMVLLPWSRMVSHAAAAAQGRIAKPKEQGI
jgi:hypothetical protein